MRIIPTCQSSYLISTNVPAVGQALDAVKFAVGARVPLVATSVARPVVAAGARGGCSVDLVADKVAVGQPVGCAVASAAVRTVLNADGRAVELGRSAVGIVILMLEIISPRGTRSYGQELGIGR